ncbi:response regulator, partial [bacterium]|nr:response regulator [bacterium]
MAVIEIAYIKDLDDHKIQFLEDVSESIAIALNSLLIQNETKDLLSRTQSQSEALQKQQEELKDSNERLEEQALILKESENQLQSQKEELRVTNEELEEQTVSLKQSESQLQAQQEELTVTNEELEEKTKSLIIQKNEIENSNINLEKARLNIEKKAEELAISSKYKSEFLANMSHELRTPLNSLLLLSKNLTKNKQGNLTEKQLKSTGIIYNSGNNLLNLINEILDLSKIEAGKMSINIEKININDIKENMFNVFSHMVQDKGLDFKINIDDDAPVVILTDAQKIEQIIKNFMSNATKFTTSGSININFFRPDETVNLSRSKLLYNQTLAIAVTDTGIGIPKDQQLAVFEAFQQADGTTSRRYGGTGLGLSICRGLTNILGGEIKLTSEVGGGSTFTLYIPIELKNETVIEKSRVPDRRKQIEKQAPKITTSVHQELSTIDSIKDDFARLKEEDQTILIIEDDLDFAETLYEICHEHDFKCIHAPSGEKGLSLARKYNPSAVILDIKLPGISGWQVLDELKDDVTTRHLPVHIMSGYEKHPEVFKKGAIGYLRKPISSEELDAAFSDIEAIISKKIKDLLIVEANQNLRTGIVEILESDNINITAVESGEKALKLINDNKFDCIVLHLSLPDMSGFDLLDRLEKKKHITLPPVIVYTGKELSDN